MAKDNDRLDLFRKVEKELKYTRFIHTMGVTFTATSLAACYGGDVRKAEMAGLLHDCAKYLPLPEMRKICAGAGLALTPMEEESAALLHSKAGSVLASTRYGVDDPEITDAIRYHTTGRPGMTLLEKIIFVADYIEPGRTQASDLPQLRKLAFENLDGALLLILKDTLAYLHSTDKEIDSMTQKTYNYYINKDEEDGDV